MGRAGLTLEPLEARNLFATLPIDAGPEDTTAFMVGSVTVTAVFVESDGDLDEETEDWTPSLVNDTFARIDSGLNWWTQMLRSRSQVHDLEFDIDMSFVDHVFYTKYEPIARRSQDHTLWVDDFLKEQGYTGSEDVETRMRMFNDEQRVARQTDWSFTLFVVNAQSDADGAFARGSTDPTGFSIPGGAFSVILSSTTPAAIAKAVGYQFSALGEGPNEDAYTARSGYLQSQNTNALRSNPNPGFVQQDSIMATGAAQQRAFDNRTSPNATLAQVGWVDSNRDGVFDIMDVPLKLEGYGRPDSIGLDYEFRGRAYVQTLPNLSRGGLANDLSLNRVSEIQYRVNSGPWTFLESIDETTADLDLVIPLPANATGTIQIRAIDSNTRVSSNVFSGSIDGMPTVIGRDGISGFVWEEDDPDGIWANDEWGVNGATVQVVDSQGQPVTLSKSVDPLSLPLGVISGPREGITFSAFGSDTDGRMGIAVNPAPASGQSFAPYSRSERAFVPYVDGAKSVAKFQFANAASSVSVQVSGVSVDAVARLEAYDSTGRLLKRVGSEPLGTGTEARLSLDIDSTSIAYILVRGHNNARIRVGRIQTGPNTSTTTNDEGVFSLPGLPVGTYSLRVTPLDNTMAPTNSRRGIMSVETAALESTAVDFAFLSGFTPWTNPRNHRDVNNDGLVSSLDALVIINEINRSGPRTLGAVTSETAPYFDVDRDGIIQALDVLIVINYINNLIAEEEGEGEGEVDVKTGYGGNGEMELGVAGFDEHRAGNMPHSLAKSHFLAPIIDRLHAPTSE
jgi:hypothetical protein